MISVNSLHRKIGLIALFCALGCTRHEAARTDTLFVALSAAPATLDPRYSTDATGMGVTALLFDSVVRLGPDLTIVGEAARSWSYKNLVYTFHFRDDLRFADGKPVTQEDIAFSFEQYRDPKNPFSSALKVVQSIAFRPDEPWTLEIRLSKFSATFLTDLSPVKILPKHAVLASGDDFGRHPVGSGPFAFVHQSANEIRLKAREDHVREVPRIPHLILKIVRDDSTRFYKMLKGEIDIAQAELPPSKVSAFQDSSKYRVFKQPGLAMTHLLVNLRDPLLKNKTVRQAIALGLHRDEIIEFKMEGLGVKATSILSPGNPFFDTSLKNHSYDPERARQLVAQAHLTGHELVLKTSNKQAVIETARVIAHQLEKIGFKVRLQSFEWGTFYDDIKKGNFQLAQMKWVGVTDPDIYRIAFHSAEVPPGRNRGHYLNPAVDKLLEQGLREENLQGRIDIYRKVQRLIFEDLPIIPLWYDTQVAIINARVQHYTLSQNGDLSALISVTKERLP